MEPPRRRGRGLLGPVILIGVGILILLWNLGLVDWNIWGVMFRLWPVILIAFGLELLFGRRSTAGSLIVLAITGALIGAAIYAMPAEITAAREAATEAIRQPLEGAARASIELSVGAGELRVGAGSDPGILVDGTAQVASGETLTRDFRIAGDTAFYTLGRDRGWRGPAFFHSRDTWAWDLRLNREVPTQLKVNTGVGVSNLDLSQLRVTEIDARVGVGKTAITMPANGQTEARINGGVGDLEVTIPSGTAARIRADAGLGGLSVPSGYERQDNLYTSPGFASAQNRVDLTIKGGVGRVSVR